MSVVMGRWVVTCTVNAYHIALVFYGSCPQKRVPYIYTTLGHEAAYIAKS